MRSKLALGCGVVVLTPFVVLAVIMAFGMVVLVGAKAGYW